MSREEHNEPEGGRPQGIPPSDLPAIAGADDPRPGEVEPHKEREQPRTGRAEPPRPERRAPSWKGAQEFPDSPQGPREPRQGPSDQRRRRSPEMDEEQWRNSRTTQGPRGEGMSHDGQNLGYGASHHTFGRTDASGSRGANFGHVGRDVNNTYLSFGAERTPPTGHYTDRDLDAVRRRYAPTTGEGRISDLLREQHVVILRARAQSGRRTTALYCLDDQLRSALPEAARRISILSPGEDLASVSRHLEDPELGPCFLLDATGAAWPRTVTDAEFRMAFGSFATQGRRLVVLVDEPAPSKHLHALLLDHEPPVARELVLAHLTDLVAARHTAPRERAEKLLADAEGPVGAGLESSPVSSWISAMSCPEEAVLLAATIDLSDLKETGTSLWEAASAQRRSWLDQRARELVAPTDPERSPWDQAYVLAGAVLNGHSGAVISWAAELFVRVLRGETPDTDGTASFFTEPVERRLRHMLVLETENGETVLELAQPELGDALLHVAWHEYSRTQRALLEWLARLCESEEHEVAVVSEAAQALAQLAGYAPDRVFERTVDLWSDWNRADSPQRCLWAAAWLMEKLVFNQSPRPDALVSARSDDPRARIVVSVARRLREWADPSALEDAQTSSSNEEQGSSLLLTYFPRWLTAMITYGTYAGRVPQIRDNATTALSDAARLGIRTRRFALLYADGNLGPFLLSLSVLYTQLLVVTATDAYRDGARAPVMRELARWSAEGSPEMLLMACRTLLSIAEVRTEDAWDRELTGPVTEVDGSDRPFDLLLWLSTGAEGLSKHTRERIRALWITALSHPDTEQAAWHRLFRWDLQAGFPASPKSRNALVPTDGGPSVSPLREYLTDLFEEVYTQPRLRFLHARLDKYYLLRTRIAPEEFPEQQGDPR